jgi:hypothetical protein
MVSIDQWKVEAIGLAVFLLVVGTAFWSSPSPFDLLPLILVFGVLAAFCATDFLSLRGSPLLMGSLILFGIGYYAACWIGAVPAPSVVVEEIGRFAFAKQFASEIIFWLGFLGAVGTYMLVSHLELRRMLAGGDLLLYVCIGALLPVWAIPNLPGVGWAFVPSVLFNSLIVGGPVTLIALRALRGSRVGAGFGHRKVLKRKDLAFALAWAIVALCAWPILGGVSSQLVELTAVYRIYPLAWGGALTISGLVIFIHVTDHRSSALGVLWHASVLLLGPLFLPVGTFAGFVRWVACIGLIVELYLALWHWALPCLYEVEDGTLAYPFVPAIAVGFFTTLLYGDVLFGTLWPMLVG